MPPKNKDPRKEQREKIRKLASDILYETHRGIHTYHLCPACKREATRTGVCWLCRAEEIEAVIHE